MKLFDAIGHAPAAGQGEEEGTSSGRSWARLAKGIPLIPFTTDHDPAFEWVTDPYADQARITLPTFFLLDSPGQRERR